MRISLMIGQHQKLSLDIVHFRGKGHLLSNIAHRRKLIHAYRNNSKRERASQQADRVTTLLKGYIRKFFHNCPGLSTQDKTNLCCTMGYVLRVFTKEYATLDDKSTGTVQA